MDLKKFCDAHWASEPHGDEPTKLDSGERARVFPPDGSCDFCADAATHSGEVPAILDVSKTGRSRFTVTLPPTPPAEEPAEPATRTRKSVRP